MFIFLWNKDIKMWKYYKSTETFRNWLLKIIIFNVYGVFQADGPWSQATNSRLLPASVATDADETSRICNLRSWPTSPEDTIYTDLGHESFNQYIIFKFQRSTSILESYLTPRLMEPGGSMLHSQVITPSTL